MVIGPIWKSQSFWLTIVSAIAAILGGIFTDGAEVELFSGAAALVIAYMVTRGVLTKGVVEAAMRAGYRATEDGKEEEINF